LANQTRFQLGPDGFVSIYQKTTKGQEQKIIFRFLVLALTGRNFDIDSIAENFPVLLFLLGKFCIDRTFISTSYSTNSKTPKVRNQRKLF
jgi:hypothetical protein